MDTKDLLKKVRAIEIKTRRMTKQVFSGEYSSAFRGRGITFSEVRNYQFSDDVRSIDWNVTARFNAPFVKIFEEERELSVFLILDVSSSHQFGTTEKSKLELLLEIAAVLSFSAVMNNDKIGAIFVSDKVEKFIPPKKGRSHAMAILQSLIELENDQKATRLSIGMQYFINIAKRRSVCVVVSDFFDENPFLEAMKIANSKHDVIALKLFDPAEIKLPRLGFVQFYDAEKNTQKWVNTSSKKVQQKYENSFLEKEKKLLDEFRRSKIDCAILSTKEKNLIQLNQLFLRRSK